MKRLIALVYLISSLTIISAQNMCHIMVEYPNWGDTLLVHTIECATGKEIEDTALLKNGNFSYDIELNSPAIMSITTPAFFERRREGQIERFVIVPGESIKCKGYKEIEGTGFPLQYAKVRNFITSLVYRNSEDKYQAILDYVMKNKDNEACVALITDYNTFFVMDEIKMKKAFSLLSPKVQNGRMRPLFDYALKQIQKNESKHKKRSDLIEKPAKDFILKDITGKEICLSAFHGKYILLDFWGSWCQPCLKALPKLKEFYEENKNKVVVIGISCLDNKIRWRKAIERFQLTWLNLIAPKDNQILDDYQITNYPTQIFISPDGHILNYANSPYSDIYAFIKKFLEE